MNGCTLLILHSFPVILLFLFLHLKGEPLNPIFHAWAWNSENGGNVPPGSVDELIRSE